MFRDTDHVYEVLGSDLRDELAMQVYNEIGWYPVTFDVDGGAARWPYFLTRLAARSVQFAVTGCIDTVLVWLLARRNALSPVLRRIKTKGSEHRDA